MTAITIASLSHARKHKRLYQAVITVEDPACRPADRLRFHRSPSPPQLVLAFEDVDDAGSGVRVATRDQVESALAFARAHQQGSILVHCFHGVGRSAALALAVLAERYGLDRERDAVAELFANRPEATPNLVVVTLADQILARDGALVSALAAWEAAAPGMAEKRRARSDLLRTRPDLFTFN